MFPNSLRSNIPLNNDDQRQHSHARCLETASRRLSGFRPPADCVPAEPRFGLSPIAWSNGTSNVILPPVRATVESSRRAALSRDSLLWAKRRSDSLALVIRRT